MARARAGDREDERSTGRLHTGANLPAELVLKFRQQCEERNFNASKLYEKFLRWFTALDRDIQIMVYHGMDDPVEFHRRMIAALEKERQAEGRSPGYEDAAGPSSKRGRRSSTKQ